MRIITANHEFNPTERTKRIASSTVSGAKKAAVAPVKGVKSLSAKRAERKATKEAEKVETLVNQLSQMAPEGLDLTEAFAAMGISASQSRMPVEQVADVLETTES